MEYTKSEDDNLVESKTVVHEVQYSMETIKSEHAKWSKLLEEAKKLGVGEVKNKLKVTK